MGTEERSRRYVVRVQIVARALSALRVCSRSVVYLERYAVMPCVPKKWAIVLGKTAVVALDALAATPLGVSGLREHVKYLALSLLSHAGPRITFRCSSPPRDPAPLA